MNEYFIKELKKINIELSNKQIKQFEDYYNLLVEWNSKINLTSILDENEVYEKHFLDSIKMVHVIDLFDQKICDIGAGAGFPSIPLKIIYPNLKITIVDSLNKRIKFLDKLVETLELDNVELVAARAEDYALNNHEKFDIVSARAVARLNILVELCASLVKINGYFISFKGKQAMIEVEEAKKGIKTLGLIKDKFYEYEHINEQSKRWILSFKKINETPNKYPRMYGKIKSKPL